MYGSACDHLYIIRVLLFLLFYFFLWVLYQLLDLFNRFGRFGILKDIFHRQEGASLLSKKQVIFTRRRDIDPAIAMRKNSDKYWRRNRWNSIILPYRSVFFLILFNKVFFYLTTIYRWFLKRALKTLCGAADWSMSCYKGKFSSL